MADKTDTLEGLKERLDELEAWQANVQAALYALNQDLHLGRRAKDALNEAAGKEQAPKPLTAVVDEGEKGLPPK